MPIKKNLRQFYRENLRHYRELARVSQEEAGQKVGLTQGTYASIESGDTRRIDPNHLPVWAAQFGCRVADFFREQEA